MTDPDLNVAISAAVKRLFREGHDLQTIARGLGWTLEDVTFRMPVAGGYPRFTPAMKAAYSQVLREFARRQSGWVGEGADRCRESVVEARSKRRFEAADFAAWESEISS